MPVGTSLKTNPFDMKVTSAVVGPRARLVYGDECSFDQVNRKKCAHNCVFNCTLLVPLDSRVKD